MNTAIDFLGQVCGDPALQWQLLAGLQALLSVWLVQATQQDQGITLLAVVVWGGAAICMEDQLPTLVLKPSRTSLLAGLVLLAYATWRSAIVLHFDAVVYVLPLLQGFGLALLARPVRHVLMFGQPLFVLSLFAMQFLATRLMPEYWLSVATGKVSQLILLLFGVQSLSVERLLKIGDDAVSIQPACSGAGQIAMVSVVAIVFVIAYPLRSQANKLLFLSVAPLIGFLVNAVRISTLAVIVSSSLPQKIQFFDFMHEEWGGLVFSGIATIIVGQIYMGMINRQLSARHG